MTLTALSTTGNDRIVPGGNMPPAELSPFDAIKTEIEDLFGEATLWADGEPISSQEIHDEIKRLHDGLHDAGNRAESMRVAEKKPLDLKIDAIQERFNPLIQPKKGKVSLGKETLNTLMAAWRRKLADAAEAKARKAREDAAALAAEAQAAMQASAGNLEQRVFAEDKLALAKEADKFAARTHKAATTGLGLRTTYRAEITDLTLALRHYFAAPERRQAFTDLVTGFADADARGGKRDTGTFGEPDFVPAIPGFRIVADKKAN